MLNGTLTGIIAQCAGCDKFEPEWSAIIGVLGGLVFLLGHKTMVYLKMDDPLDAVAVHAGGGSNIFLLHKKVGYIETFSVYAIQYLLL